MKKTIFTFLIKAAFFFFGLLPDWAALMLGRFVGLILRIISFKKNQIVKNLNLVYGSKEKWPEGIISRLYRHFGLLAVELLRMPSLNGENFMERTTLSGLENVDKALERNEGAILISAHTGNWEYGIAGLAGRGYNANVVVKNLKDMDNEYLFEKLRGSKGVGSILKDKAVLNIRRILRKNGICVLVIDQHSKSSEGVRVEHFGEMASTYAAPYVLSKKFKCPVLPAFIYREDDLRTHHAVFYPEIPFQESDDKEEEMRLNVQSYLKPFEEFLLKHPDQWIWMHKRWRF